MPSKHISYISEGAEQHVSYHFDTIQEMIEFERSLQESTFEKYHKDQEVAREVVSEIVAKVNTPINYHPYVPSHGDIDPVTGDLVVIPRAGVDAQEKSRPWIIDWEKVEEDFGPEYKWFAVDEDGETWVYTGRPKLSRDEEGESYSRFYPDCYDRTSMVQQRHIIQKGTVPWNESLVKKPEKS